MTLGMCVATMKDTDIGCADTFVAKAKTFSWEHVHIQRNTKESNLGVFGSYQKLYETTTEDILFYIHDDCECREDGYDERLIREFEDPEVGVVGFCGALHHGTDDIYRTPYRMQQLARNYVLSNTDDAESHGERFTGSRDVAVVDGFSIAVRRVLLDKCGSWNPDQWPPHHLYDYYICAEAHRHRYRVRVLGIRCHHYGGRTATSSDYLNWANQTQWGSDAEFHAEGHRLFYNRYRDVLPLRCK